MKQLVYFASALLLTVIACQKDDESTSLTYVISRDSIYNGNANDNRVSLYEYNSSKKLVKVQYKYGTSNYFNGHDTLYYNGSGQVSKVESYYNGASGAISTSLFTYSSGVLTAVAETGTNDKGPFALTRTYSYSAGKLSAITTVYITGSSNSNDSPDNISEIVFTGDNITSLNLAGQGIVKATYDLTATNPYSGLNNTEDFINLFCKNNILKAFLVSNPSQVFVDNTYTYVDGRVSTITDVSQTPARTTKITYKGI